MVFATCTEVRDSGVATRLLPYATIRHRTTRMKGCVTRDSMLHMMFKLGQCAEKNWRKLRGFKYLARVVEGVKFVNGEEIEQANQVAA